MPALQSPFLGVNYGWSLDEDNWNVGMDENLLKISAMLYGTVDGIGPTTPGMNTGEVYFNTFTNKLEYSVNGVNYSVTVPIGYSFGDKVTGKRYTVTPSGLVSEFDEGSADSRYILKTASSPFGLTLLAAQTAASGRSTLGLGSASTQAISAFEPALPASSVSFYLKGDRTWGNFYSEIRGTPLSGLSLSSTTSVSATDSILVAIGKLQANMTLRAPINSPSFTGTPSAPTVTEGDVSTKIATTEFVSRAVSQSGSLAAIQAIVLSFL